jgi:hypothetical protein
LSWEGFPEAVETVRVMVKENAPIVTASDGTEWAQGSLSLLRPPIDQAAPLTVNTLSALADLIIEDPTVSNERPLIIHVESPSTVSVFSRMNDRRARETVIKATARKTIDPTGWKSVFDFNLAVLVGCVDTPERASLLEFTGNINASEIFTVVDDGVSQTASVSRGVQGNRVRETAPRIVNLRPFRSFPEVEQAESPFVLRLRNKGEGEIEIGLFECDGGAWMLAQMKSVAEWITDQLFRVGDQSRGHLVIW